ncbi:hypothetical protein K7472_32115 [Streptomyces sp. PTM05]|uniref:Integration host factor-like helix-two turn-helix domain-containing protein n=1 Tax=Streptantibioticus parmotrematis TaxID=2873249 RepID=A0ABS7R1X2_9ACTN|nr:hypothetical protein [Streptantibioticus parmotrematis]MBY8889447.1 hypothetical protein [Streptantibioticus parmotrematis]
MFHHSGRVPQAHQRMDIARRDRLRLLGEVSTGGTTALLRILRRAGGPEDPAAAHVRFSALLRALPGMGALTAHEILNAAGVAEHQRVGDLRPGQLAVLMRALDYPPRSAQESTQRSASSRRGPARGAAGVPDRRAR